MSPKGQSTMANRWITGSVIVATAVALVTAAVQFGMIIERLQQLEDQLRTERTVSINVPHSAIVAFDSNECPAGWRRFARGAGRVIVGTGRHSQFDEYGNELAPWTHGTDGGSRSHQLVTAEMPVHAHTYVFSTGRNSPQHVDQSPDEFGYKNLPNHPTGSAGGGEPHNNMPPFLALSLCERD